MAIKLSVCVPHYNEEWETCRFLFDTLATQRGISFKEIEVLIGEDGLVKPFYPDMFTDYPFKVTIYPLEHRGVSATRNTLLKRAKGKYVMFCDCDDGFCSNYGLFFLFGRMKKKPDVIISSFVEEGWTEGKFTVIRHDNDMQFIHGKAYRKAFLEDREITFKDELLVHEDGYFNTIVGNEAKTYENIENPFYIWRWNDKSTVRQGDGQIFLMKTYPQLIDTRDAVCEELKKRGFKDEYLDAVAKTIIDAYYEFQKELYADNTYVTEKTKFIYRIREFAVKYIKDFSKCDADTIANIMQISRNTAFKRGMKIESMSLGQFVDYLFEVG